MHLNGKRSLYGGLFCFIIVNGFGLFSSKIAVFLYKIIAYVIIFPSDIQDVLLYNVFF